MTPLCYDKAVAFMEKHRKAHAAPIPKYDLSRNGT
jgi:hypothetical protein